MAPIAQCLQNVAVPLFAITNVVAPGVAEKLLAMMPRVSMNVALLDGETLQSIGNASRLNLERNNKCQNHHNHTKLQFSQP